MAIGVYIKTTKHREALSKALIRYYLLHPRPKPIIHYCLECGKETTNPKLCSRTCVGKYASKDLTRNRKISVALKGRTFPNMSECGKRLNQYLNDHPELRRRGPYSEESRKINSESHMGLIYEEVRKRWQNPEYKEKRLKAMMKGLYQSGLYLTKYQRPNKAEQALQSILDEVCPNEFEYTGDGKIVILGMIPDFTNVNGKKKVIELFGEYWHSSKILGNHWKGSELGRIMAYNSMGYRCLIIWEKELKDKELIIEKIRKFKNAKTKSYRF